MENGLRKIIPAGIFIFFVAFCGLAVFYYRKIGPGLTARYVKTVSPGRAVAESGDLRAGREPPAPDYHAGKINEEEERQRDEGFLWVDRNSAKYVVTLGAFNGILSGGYLAVYDDDRMVGRVKVETVRDVIAYVQPLTATRDLLTKDYYRVVKERR